MSKIFRSTIFWVIVIGFFLGFFWAAFVHNQILREIVEATNILGWYFHILLALFAVFMVILVHELGHLFAAIHQKIKVKAIYVLFFALVKNKRWQFKIFLKFAKMVGGVVIPVIEGVYDDQAYEKRASQMSKVIKAGPVSSTIYAVVILVILIIGIILNIPLMIALLFWFTFVTVLFTLLVYAASNMSHEGLHGDFVARKEIKTDEAFCLSYMLSGSQFAYDEKQDAYLWQRLTNYLKTATLPGLQPTQTLIITYIAEIIAKSRQPEEQVNERILQIPVQVKQSEEALILNYQLAFFYGFLNEMPKAYPYLEKIKATTYKVPNSVLTYWQKYAKNYFGTVDNSEFLVDKKNYHPTSTQWLYSPLDYEIPTPTVLDAQTLVDVQDATNTNADKQI